jgi:predicted N-acetyltransferase YhbS
MSQARAFSNSVSEAAGKPNLPERGYGTHSASKLTLRRASLRDAPRTGEICFQAFKTIAERHAFPPDFPSADAATNLFSQIIARPDVYSVVAELDGRVVGSNFLWEAGAVAGVGPITVEPAVQDSAVGRRLMEAVLERARLQEHPAVRLVQAAYHNRTMALYTKLGFVAREPLSVLQGPALRMRIDGYAVRAATEADLDSANALCRCVHGHDRASELRDAMQRGSAMVVERSGRITGYATDVGFFGHAVAESTGDVRALIAAAAEFSGPGFLVPTRDTELLRWCLEHGLRIAQPMTLMTIGPYEQPKGAFLASILY